MLFLKDVPMRLKLETDNSGMLVVIRACLKNTGGRVTIVEPSRHWRRSGKTVLIADKRS